MEATRRRPALLLAKAQVATLLVRSGFYCTTGTLTKWQTESGGYFVVNRKIDLIRFIGWAALRFEKKRNAGQSYEQHRENMRDRQLARSRSGRDIAPLPAVVDPARKASSSKSLKLFCETYLAPTFCLPWAGDHVKIIELIELAVLHGGLFAMAMPRGSGKTSLCEAACLWAILYGYREFIVLIGASQEHANNMLDSIKVELETNELLHGDFPEACHAVASLQAVTQRASAQLFEGKPTYMEWMKDTVVLPMIPGSPAAGSIIRVAGLTSHFRGMKHKRPDGTSIRPSLVFVDDPQTDDSARSPSQSAQRERILAGAVLGLAGPTKKIAGLMPVTVIRQDDMADRILDRDKHPDWQGQRMKMVYEFPTNEDLWGTYEQIRADSLRAGDGISAATEFYRAHQEEMDLGSVVAWPVRFNYDELSAIQHAMNLRFRSEAAFFAEYQNEPLPDDEPDDELLSADEITKKLNAHKRGVVPLDCTHLTMFIDVQSKCLYWIVIAWDDRFTGYVIAYGAEPDPKRAYFTLKEVRKTLMRAAPRAGLEGAIYAGLERLTSRTLGREWKRDDGAVVRIDRCLIDAGWGMSTDVIYKFCRQSDHASVLLPSHGRYVGASSMPFSEYTRKPGDRVGLNWRVPLMTNKRAIRHVLYDTNYWKSFIHARLAVGLGDAGCLSLFGSNHEAHRMIADHLTAEFRVKTEGRGRTVDEWKIRVEGRDNHLLDCVVGASVAASMQGAELSAHGLRRKKKKIKLSELQRAKRQ